MNPKQAIEGAAYAYATATETNIELIENFYRGIENSHDADSQTEATLQTIQIPCVILEAQGDFQEIIQGTRNYRGNLSVTVRGSALKLTGAEFEAMCAEVFSKFAVQDLAAQLTAAADDFHCYQAHPVSVGTAYRTAEGMWEAEATIDCVIACSDLG